MFDHRRCTWAWSRELPRKEASHTWRRHPADTDRLRRRRASGDVDERRQLSTSADGADLWRRKALPLRRAIAVFRPAGTQLLAQRRPGSRTGLHRGSLSQAVRHRSDYASSNCGQLLRPAHRQATGAQRVHGPRRRAGSGRPEPRRAGGIRLRLVLGWLRQRLYGAADAATGARSPRRVDSRRHRVVQEWALLRCPSARGRALGLSSPDEVFAHRSDHLRRVRQVMEQADVLVFTWA